MRADFTRSASSPRSSPRFLMTGRPALAHRDLSNAIPALMRPRDRQWLWARTHDERSTRTARRAPTSTGCRACMFRAMYEPSAGFVRSCKEADGDYAAIGNAVLSVEPNECAGRAAAALLASARRGVDRGQRLKINQVHHKAQALGARPAASSFPKTVDVERCEPRAEGARQARSTAGASWCRRTNTTSTSRTRRASRSC
jgi:hypothetical protein